MRFENMQRTNEVRAALETAVEFGLDQAEVWDAMVETWERVCAGQVEDPFEELTSALASRILERERRR